VGHTPAECALLFESLGKKQEDVFFHCDQLIRGMYSVFVEHWLASFRREDVLVSGRTRRWGGGCGRGGGGPAERLGGWE
jgi:hypothetical protein